MSGIRYTEEQDLTLRTRQVPVAVDAGAGCGKTFVLTERFLSHLDPTWEDAPASLDEVVAITFTDAAAREMRDRIRKKCRERLVAARGEAVGFWRGLLRSLDAARVSTIHGFASRLVREHAIELGIDPAFTVLDPAEGRVLLSSAVDDALRTRLEPRRDGGLDDELLDTAAEYDLVGLRQRVRTIADHARDPAFAPWLRRTPEDVVAPWLAYYRERVAGEYARGILADARLTEFREALSTALPTGAEFRDRVADLYEALDGLADAVDPDAALKRLHSLLPCSREGTKGLLYGDKDFPDKESKKGFTAARNALADLLKKQRRAGDPETMRRAAELGLRVQRIAHEAAGTYRKAKRTRGVLDTDDLLFEAHRLLTDPTLADARGRIAGRVRVLLVDEFQDTDALQADLVQAIAGEPDAQSGRLFLVGDFKQSIYRFRGAVPDVFQDRREATPAEGRLTLSTNFRSTPAVLGFVNRLFAPAFGDAYVPLRAAREQLTPGPAAEFLWTPAAKPDNATVRRTAEARSIAGRIQELIDSHEPCVVDRDTTQLRGARPGDFAILFRALSNVALYEDALRDAGIEYYLVGGHAFYSQQEVFDTLHLLRSVLSGSDDLALAGTLRSPLFGVPDEALFWVARRGSLNAGLFGGKLPAELTGDALRTVEHARRALTLLRTEKDRLSAAELLRLAWEQTGYDATLLADFLGRRKAANLEKIHEQAREADGAGSGLRGLADRLAEFVSQPPKEALAATTAGDSGAVRLMTVHGSKGLEFPIVVLADINSKVKSDSTVATFDPLLGPLLKPGPDADESDAKAPVGLDFWRAVERPQEDAERNRLFYVACTRAADRLILSASREPEAPPVNPWMRLLGGRFDLDTGQALDGPAEGLVAVTAPTTAPGVAHTGPKRRLGEALEAARAAGVVTGRRDAAAEPIAIDPRDLLTFSVSRLSGGLERGNASESAAGGADPDGVDPRRLGTLVHAVIERLDPRAPSWEKAIERWTNALAPQHLRRGVSRGASEAKVLVRRFVTTPAWAAMRAADRLDREVEFHLRWPADSPAGPTAILRGYLDALYRDADGRWHVVDYKTNSVTPEGAPRAAEGYALQMAVYAHAIEAATGEPPASLSLVFLAAGVTHSVPWDAPARAASRGAIDRALAAAREPDSP